MRTRTLARNMRAMTESRHRPCREEVRLLDGQVVVCESQDQVDAWTGLCEALRTGEIKPSELQIRELFEHCIRDGHEVVESWNPRYGGSGAASYARVCEADAVGTANFARIMGQFAYSQIMAAYTRPAFVFSQIVPNRPTMFQNGERIPGLSRLGDQSGVIGENAEYPRASVSQDWLDTPATTKRGLIVEWTKELIYLNGTTSGEPLPLMERLTDVGAELGYNKEVRLIDAFIDENTTAHRYNRLSRGQIATYGDNSGMHDFDNLQATNALVDWTDIDNAAQLLFAMLDPNTGQPISIGMDSLQLVVPRGLQTTANYIARMTGMEVNAGGYATNGNLIRTISQNPLPFSLTPLTSDLLALRMATDTSWYLADVASMLVYLENWPITVVQRPPNSEAEFERDVIGGIKVSEKGQAYVREPRKGVKCTA